MGFLTWLVGDSEKELEIAKAIACVILVDGKVTDEECKAATIYTNNIGFTGISQSTIEKGIKCVANGEAPDFSKFTEKEKKELLKACGKIAAADNEVTEDEQKIVMVLGSLMGYDANQIQNILLS